jgi:hypothetical protein
MYFLHIHKSGGHSICYQAQQNAMVGNFDNICNVQEDQHCCGDEDSLEAQIRFAQTTNFTFVAAEQEMYDAMATQYYDYIVVLRNSKTRYKSHWRHLVDNANVHFVSSTTSVDRVHDRYVVAMHGKPQPVGNFTKWWQKQPDNYNFRMICGARCRDIPKFQITEEIYQYTMKRLSKFAHVMFMEDMGRSFNHFAQSVGWKTIAANSSELHQNAKAPNPAKFSSIPIEMAWDPFMTILDDALYDVALQNYQVKIHEQVSFGPGNLTRSLIQNYFDTGHQRGCQNPCCGDCSIW